MNVGSITPERVAEAVESFNSVYGEMDEVLWCISKAAREDLLKGRPSPVVEGLVWTIRSWWGVQGAKRETKTYAARALTKMKWVRSLFDDEVEGTAISPRFALDRVSDLVAGMQKEGAERQEFSLASKTLHWLMPWRIPVYDSFVKSSLGINQDALAVSAYRKITEWQRDNSKRMMASGDTRWLGSVNPRSPLRALDKYLWWVGGGAEGNARQVNDPWAVCQRLGLDC